MLWLLVIIRTNKHIIVALNIDIGIGIDNDISIMVRNSSTNNAVQCSI